MDYTRRDFGKLALAGVPAAALLERSLVVSLLGAERPNSVINGVHIGTITYSYRSMPDQSAQAVLKYVVDSGISAIELMNGPAESFAGGPAAQRGRGGRRGRPQTPDEQAAQRGAADHLKNWRLSVSMDKYRALRKMYTDAGVTIYAWKCLTPSMSDEEFEYVFNVAEALGCTHTTLELTDDVAQLKRISAFAEKHNLRGLSHAHSGQHDRVRSGVRGVEGEPGERRPGPLCRGRQRRRQHASIPREVPRSDRQLPPQGSDYAGARREEPAVGHRRYAAEADPSAREEEQVDDAGGH